MNMQHPHLLFDEKNLDKLISQINKGKRSRAIFNIAKSNCEAICDPNSKYYLDYRERKSYYWHERGKDGKTEIAAKLLSLALIGWLGREQKFLDVCKDALLLMIREDIFDNLGSYVTWRKNGLHDSGKFFAMLGILYDLLYPHFNATEKKQVLHFCQETLEISIEFFEVGNKFIDNNRGNRYLAGRTILGCAIYQDDSNYKFAEHCAHSGPLFLEKGLRLAFGQDGEPFEGASYGTSHLGFLYLTAHILKRLDIRDSTQDRRFKAMGEYILRETVTSGPENEVKTLNQGWINNLNDANKIMVPDALYFAALDNNNPFYFWLWDRYAFDPDYRKAPCHPEFVIEDFNEAPWKLLWPDDQVVEPKHPNESEITKTFHFRDRGVISSRSGWSQEDLHATIFSGRNSLKGHYQGDQGQITFYGLGEHFLIDTGYASDVVTNNESESHNLITIDGKGQGGARLDQLMGWPIGYIENYFTSKHHFEVKCDLREAYPHHSSLLEANRTFYFKHSGEIPHAICFDKFNCDNQKHLYSLYLQTAIGNRFEIQDNIITIYGRNNSLDIHFMTNNSVEFKEDICADHPRLRISQTATYAEYLLLLHPWTDPEARIRPIFKRSEKNIDIVIPNISGNDIKHRF